MDTTVRWCCEIEHWDVRFFKFDFLAWFDCAGQNDLWGLHDRFVTQRLLHVLLQADVRRGHLLVYQQPAHVIHLADQAPRVAPEVLRQLLIEAWRTTVRKIQRHKPKFD